MKAREIVKITRGKLLSGDPAGEIDPARISTDSRTIKNGGFFIALKGANFDGNNFVGAVLQKGAVGAIVSGGGRDQGAGAGKIIIQVKDTTKALQQIAACHREKFRIPVIAVTGSNGKTTVKDMVWHILSSKYNVLRNEGTKNNHIGVPQTLLKLGQEHDFCVLEMGTNHKGEIALLADIARPTAAVFTNIGPSHLEFLGGLEGVFRAKKEMLPYLEKEGLVVLNGDDRFLSRIAAGDFRVIKYGFKGSNDLRAEALGPEAKSLIFVVNNKMVFELNLFGRHNIYNALAAIAVAMSFGIDHRTIRGSLAGYRPPDMRLVLEKVCGIDILNDSYNSNPLSMTHALEVLKYYPANARWIVSGDMLELGKESERFHRMIGATIAKSDVEGLVTLGKYSRHTSAQAATSGMRRDRLWHCSTHDEIAQVLKRVVKAGDVILLKGSRSMRMERVLEKLNSKFQLSKFKTCKF